MTGLTMLLFGRMWSWGIWVWNAVECLEWGFMGNPSRNMKDIVAEGSNKNSRVLLAQ